MADPTPSTPTSDSPEKRKAVIAAEDDPGATKKQKPDSEANSDIVVLGSDVTMANEEKQDGDKGKEKQEDPPTMDLVLFPDGSTDWETCYCNLKRRANNALDLKKHEISELRTEIKVVKDSCEVKVEACNQERDKIQKKALKLAGENVQLAKNQDEYNESCLDTAKKWQQNELKRQTAEIEDDREHKLGVSRRQWEKKFQIQDKRHSTEITNMRQKLRDAQDELKVEKEAIKTERKQMIEEQKQFKKDHKPENTARVKALSDEVRKKEETIERLEEERDACLSKLNEAKKSIVQLEDQGRTLLSSYRVKNELAKKLESDISTLKAKFQSHLFEVETLKQHHASQLRQQSERWAVQRDNSHENAQRAVSHQRMTFQFRMTIEKLIQEKEELRKRLVLAEGKLEKVEGAEGAERVCVGLKGKNAVEDASPQHSMKRHDGSSSQTAAVGSVDREAAGNGSPRPSIEQGSGSLPETAAVGSVEKGSAGNASPQLLITQPPTSPHIFHPAATESTLSTGDITTPQLDSSAARLDSLATADKLLNPVDSALPTSNASVMDSPIPASSAALFEDPLGSGLVDTVI